MTSKANQTELQTEKVKKRKILPFFILGIAILTLAALIVCAVLIFKSFPAEDYAVTAMTNPEGVSITALDDDKYVFFPDVEPSAGLVFYTGARVEYQAYAPLMLAFADKGIMCVLIDAPANLALFAKNAPDGVIEKYPMVTKWYVGGHSLGGSVASMYAADHPDDFDGLLLIASYSTSDLSDIDLNVISVYGENDGVLNKDSYEKCRKNLPESFSELVIPGGNHAGFAYYGDQPGDHTATITKSEQIAITAGFFADHK